VTPCTAGEIRPLLAAMIPDVDTTRMGVYEIMNLIKAMLRDRSKSEIVDRLKAMVPGVTAPALTVDELLNTIEIKFSAGKALDSYMDQILARLKVMTGVDIGNVDEGLARIEAQFKDVNDRCKSLRTNLCLSHDMPASVVLDRAIVTLENTQTENAYMHRIMGRVQAKANALLLNPREKITDVCQALDAVHAEYDHVKARALKSEALAVERENMISDAIGELRLILGTPKTEDLTLAKITDLLKVKASEGREYHARLCGAVHVLTSTPMDRVVNETVRVIGSRDYYVKALLSRFVNEGVTFNDKTVDDVLAMIEAEQKTLTERLGTSYAREMTLVKELADAKTQLATAGKESADLARALHLAEDKINAQAVHMGQGEYLRKVLTNVGAALGMADPADVDHVLTQAQDVVTVSNNRANLIKDLDGETHAYRKALGLDKSAWHGAIVAKIEELTASVNTGLDPIREAMNMRGADTGMLVTWCESMRHKLSAALEQARDANKRCVSLGNDLNKIYDLAHVSRSADLPTLWAKITRMRDLLTKGESESMGMIESLSKSVDTFKAERSTLARFRDDMRTVLGEKNATAKYMVDTVDEMRRDMASIRSVLGYPFATTREVLTQIQAMHDGANRVRDAIGLRSDAPIDYVVQRIADTRRDMLWAQGTVSMVSAALTGSQTAERTEIMATLSGTIKGRERAQERAADLYTTLCTDLNMPTTLNLDEIRDRVQGLITLRSNMRTFLGKDMTDEQLLDQVTHLISLRSEYQSVSDTLSILRRSLGLGVDCDKTTIVAKVEDMLKVSDKDRDRLIAVLGEDKTGIKTLSEAVSRVEAMAARFAMLLSLREERPLSDLLLRVGGILRGRTHEIISAPALRELVLTMGQTETMTADEAMVSATARIKGMREALSDLLSTWS